MPLRPGITALFVLGLTMLPARIWAQADIDNGSVRLGVNDSGGLGITPINTPKKSAKGINSVGIRYVVTNNDGEGGPARAEGWGVADASTKQWGGVFGGNPTKNLTLTAFSATANSATAQVDVGGIFDVTHDYQPATDPNAYEITVTIKNISAAAVNVWYRRTIDWDVEPTINKEIVTVQGATLPGVLNFARGVPGNANPLTKPNGTNGNVIRSGPSDQGYAITLDLGSLNAGATATFKIYYGAGADSAAALATIAALGLNVYSLAEPNDPAGAPNTFFFGLALAPPPGPAVILTESGGDTQVSEGGATDTYTVVLNAAPTADVTIALTTDSQVSVSPTVLTFTTANWATPQTVTVTAVDDRLFEGTHAGSLTHAATSADAGYNGILIPDLNPNVTDNDTALVDEGSYYNSPGPALNGEGACQQTAALLAPRARPRLIGPLAAPGNAALVYSWVAPRDRATPAGAETPALPLPLAGAVLAGIALAGAVWSSRRL